MIGVETMLAPTGRSIRSNVASHTRTGDLQLPGTEKSSQCLYNADFCGSAKCQKKIHLSVTNAGFVVQQGYVFISKTERRKEDIMTAYPFRDQVGLFNAVSAEVKRIRKHGMAPAIATVNPVPDNCLGPDEVELVIEVREPDDNGVQEVIRLGSYWLVPELLERLQRICFPVGFQLAPLLYAVQEFSSDMELIMAQD